MNINIINLKINKDIIKRKYFLKKELKTNILKSLIQNKNIKPIVRLWIYLNLIKKKKKYSKTQQENRCLITGKAKTTFKMTSLSRHITKKFIDLGLLQNLKAENY